MNVQFILSQSKIIVKKIIYFISPTQMITWDQTDDQGMSLCSFRHAWNFLDIWNVPESLIEEGDILEAFDEKEKRRVVA